MVQKSFLYETIVNNAKNIPDSIAFYYRKKKEVFSYTYADVFNMLYAVRNVYVNINKSKFGILSENNPEYFVITTGILAAGKDLAFLDTQANFEDLVNTISFSDLEEIVYDEDNEDLVQNLKEKLPDVGFTRLEMPEVKAVSPSTPLDWKDGDSIFYTSGSTKSSKAVITPTTSITGNIRGLSTIRSYDKGKTCMNPLPYHHSYGYTALHLYYYLQCPIFISSMKTVMKDIGYAKPVMMTLVPSTAEFLLSKKAFNPELKYTVISGAYLPPALAKDISDCGIVVQNQYGSSEIPSGFANNMKDDSIDCLTFHNEMKIRIAEDGEVIITTPYHFKEYYKNPEDTAEMLIDGEIHTGDMGFLDDKGRLHLLGRRKNMIIMKNGEKVFYTDIDEDLKKLKGVADAAAIYRDSNLVAVIAPEAGVTKEQIQAEIDKYNLIQPVSRLIKKLWIYGPKLPYTSSGKMQRSIIEKDWDQGKAVL